jgi:hypothetical protein
MGTIGTLTTATSLAAAQQAPLGTKLSDLIDEIGTRLPADRIPHLIPVVNRAVMILSKHLYVRESDIIKGELSMSIFAEQTYTASTISFVSGGDAGADTIVDSAGQFVIEGFVAGMPITTDASGNAGPFKIVSVTSTTITLRSTDKVTAATEGTSVTITSQDNYGYLPDDFWGFISEPNIQGKYETLRDVPNKTTQLAYAIYSAGTPIYATLYGDRLRVYPGTSIDIVIEGQYWVRPTKLTTLDDYIPFYGLFDDVIQDYIIAILAAGTAGTTEVAGILTTAVDLIVAKREKKAPEKMPQGYDYGGMHE